MHSSRSHAKPLQSGLIDICDSHRFRDGCQLVRASSFACRIRMKFEVVGMRRTISSVWLWLSVLLMLSGALRAQDLVGDWQGTLVIGQAKLRTILKVSTGPDKKLTAEFYSI